MADQEKRRDRRVFLDPKTVTMLMATVVDKVEVVDVSEWTETSLETLREDQKP